MVRAAVRPFDLREVRRLSRLLPPLTGVWVRSLIELPDGTRDTSTFVTWVQAGSWFVDLRLPADGPEGFAGSITLDGDICTWRRELDLSPPSVLDDIGRLWVNEDGVLVEDGVEVDYTEHWHDRAVPGAPWASVALRDDAGEPAILVRVGDVVGWAHGVYPAAEISLARVVREGWLVEASSAPELLGTPLAVRVGDGQVGDWQVVAAEGEGGLLA